MRQKAFFLLYQVTGHTDTCVSITDAVLLSALQYTYYCLSAEIGKGETKFL